MKVKLIFRRKVVHLASFWKWGFWNSEVAYLIDWLKQAMTLRSHLTEPPVELALQAKTKCFPYQHGKSSCHAHCCNPSKAIVDTYIFSITSTEKLQFQSLSSKPSIFFKRHVALWGDLDRIFKIQKRLGPVMLDTFTNDNKVKVINNSSWLPINDLTIWIMELYIFLQNYIVILHPVNTYRTPF